MNWFSPHPRSALSRPACLNSRGGGDRVHDWPLIANLQRVGKMLRSDRTGVWSARHGTYRVLYRINDTAGEVVVLRIDHRSRRLPPLNGQARHASRCGRNRTRLPSRRVRFLPRSGTALPRIVTSDPTSATVVSLTARFPSLRFS